MQNVENVRQVVEILNNIILEEYESSKIHAEKIKRIPYNMAITVILLNIGFVVA